MSIRMLGSSIVVAQLFLLVAASPAPADDARPGPLGSVEDLIERTLRPQTPVCCKSAGALCRSECERGILRLHFTVTDANGRDACPEEPTVVLHCDPYTCDAEGRTCREVCQSDSECAGPGYACDDTHLPNLGQCLPYVFTCDGDATLRAPNGDEVSCAPYACKGHQCLNSCESTADCSPGRVCGTEATCVVP